MRINGSVIGSNVVPNLVSGASGIWGLQNVDIANRSSSWPTELVTNGLVLALDASDRNSFTSGSMTWTDLSGNNIPVTFNNPGSASFSNNSINFTPTSTSVNTATGSFYSITDSRISSLTTELTLETWVNPSTANINQTRPVSPRTTETGSPLGFSLGSNRISYEINTTNGWSPYGIKV